MAVFSTDVSLTASNTALYEFKLRSLVSTYGTTNWSVRSSGTGTGGVYAQSGDVISAASVLANPGAWWVMKGHAYIDGNTTYRQELCWQTDGSGGVRLKRSARAGFAGGSPGPGRVPSASDERVVWGGGSDASPTYTALWPASASWFQARYDEANDSIWAFAYPVGGGAATAIFAILCCAPQRDSVGLLVDPDPYGIIIGTGTSCALEARLASETYGPLATLAYGTADELWARVPALVRCSRDSGGALQPVAVGHLPASPYRSNPTYAQDTLRLARRSELSGTTQAGEAGNTNVCGDKGEELYLRYSGRTYTTPTLLGSVQPSNGYLTGSSLIGVGNLILPYELGAAIRDGA